MASSNEQHLDLQRMHDSLAGLVATCDLPQIAVAYPFSATPTRHRDRIGDQVDVYAICAVDAAYLPIHRTTRVPATIPCLVTVAR